MDFLKHPLKNEFDWRPLERMEGVIPTPIDPIPELVDNKRKIGIEVEVENIGRSFPYNTNVWHMKEDGSLRNHGYEFISYPIKGDAIRYGLAQFFEALPRTADFSDRTSIHIHVNARDFTKEELLNLVMLYIVFERLLYQYAGAQRYKNIFCIPLQETKLPTTVMNFLTHGNISQLIREWHKYSGMNLIPLQTLGSIEFRHMEGNRDLPRIIGWINLLFRLFKAAKGYEFETLFTRINKLNSNSFYEDFVHQIFQTDAPLLVKNNLKYLMEPGVSTVKHVALPSPFLEALVKTIRNDSPLLLALGISDKFKVQPPIKKQASIDSIDTLPIGEFFANTVWEITSEPLR